MYNVFHECYLEFFLFFHIYINFVHVDVSYLFIYLCELIPFMYSNLNIVYNNRFLSFVKATGSLNYAIK